MLQHALQHTFYANLECSPTSDKYNLSIHRFGNMLDARLLSMPDRSTSELLRTL
jgi:hypothetical protein